MIAPDEEFTKIQDDTELSEFLKVWKFTKKSVKEMLYKDFM